MSAAIKRKGKIITRKSAHDITFWQIKLILKPSRATQWECLLLRSKTLIKQKFEAFSLVKLSFGEDAEESTTVLMKFRRKTIKKLLRFMVGHVNCRVCEHRRRISCAQSAKNLLNVAWRSNHSAGMMDSVIKTRTIVMDLMSDVSTRVTAETDISRCSLRADRLRDFAVKLFRFASPFIAILAVRSQCKLLFLFEAARTSISRALRRMPRHHRYVLSNFSNQPYLQLLWRCGNWEEHFTAEDVKAGNRPASRSHCRAPLSRRSRKSHSHRVMSLKILLRQER